ncbi:TIGR02678 family protein [Streptomyces sp. NPDC086554]|uniref:TIGR02678 family protein n=1 Tax=Streptomyces sp. NPDC086554 TaxID=3154864 RepID=UPI00343CA805
MTRWHGPEAAELQDAVRILLDRPLLRRGHGNDSALALVRGHQAVLQEWFEHQLGWRLHVERDLARLHKVPTPGTRHPADAPTGRQCALYCLLLAAVDDCGPQTVITELAERIVTSTTAEPGVRTFDPTQYRERANLVAAIRLLCDHGVLTPVERAEHTTQERGYMAGDGDALYTVHHRTATLLLSGPTAPSQAGGPDGLLETGEPRTDEAVQRRIRQHLMRRLVDEPVLYVDRLTGEEQEYYAHHRRELVAAVQNGLGTQVEVRAEGAAVVDDELGDLRFPHDTTVPYAALLLADALWHEENSTFRRRTVPTARLLELAQDVADQLTRVVKNIKQRPLTADTVLHEAQLLLARLDLIDELPTGIRLLPALARYRSTTAPSRVDADMGLVYGTPAEPEEPREPTP